MTFGMRRYNEYSYDLTIDYSDISPAIHGSRELESLFFNLADKAEKENLYDAGKPILDVNIPVSVFRQGQSGLQAAVKFLKEERQLSYSEISRILSRDPRTIWATYSSISGSSRLKISSNETEYISSKIIANRKYSVLESLSMDLRSQGFSLTETAKLLGKDPKTIWTVLARARDKTNKMELSRK